jgi:hypothetical protein
MAGLLRSRFLRLPSHGPLSESGDGTCDTLRKATNKNTPQPPPKTKGVQCAVLSVQGSWSGVQWVLMIMCAVCSVDLGFQC